MDSSEESIEDQDLVGRLREKARSINRRALVVATVITLVVFVFPG